MNKREKIAFALIVIGALCLACCVLLVPFKFEFPEYQETIKTFAYTVLTVGAISIPTGLFLAMYKEF